MSSRRTEKEYSPVQTLTALSRRRRDAEEGFTLIELMVVVLIIAILIAIAIPTFLGARTRAQDRAAQSSLRNALTAAKRSEEHRRGKNGATAATLQGIEQTLTFVVGASTTFKQVSVVAPVTPFGNWWAEATPNRGADVLPAYRKGVQPSADSYCSFSSSSGRRGGVYPH